MRAPAFWYPATTERAGPLPWLLSPLALCYAMAGWLRNKFAGSYRAPVPVICVGNLTAGGAGKTPVAIALAERLMKRGVRVHLLTRGYGGTISGPLRADPALHDFTQVGDEALLLADVAPTWVTRNRKAGAMAAVAAGAQLLILDDGHQNPHLHKDLSLVLVDVARGFGNGWVLPSGPLREPVGRGMARADAVVMIGDGGNVPDSDKPQLRAHRRLRHPETLRGKAVYAFCGIGAPQQFFDMLANAGAMIMGKRAFPDHHPFTDDEMKQVISAALKLNASPVTTEKDLVRLSPEIRARVTAIGMEMVFSDEGALAQLLDKVLHTSV